MIARWQEPPPAKQTRVLPVPDMEPKKRRGGRRCACSVIAAVARKRVPFGTGPLTMTVSGLASASGLGQVGSRRVSASV